jgi:hypothetical protein
MEFTITLPALAIALLAYYSGRYLYFALLKYRSGHLRPFDPRYNYRVSSWLDWQRGYEQGQAKIIHQYHLEQCCEDKAVLKWIKGYKDLEEELREL